MKSSIGKSIVFFIVLVSSVFLVVFILSVFSYPILDFFISIFDMVFGFAICVILIALFVGFILNQQKKQNKNKVRQVDINSIHNSSGVNQSPSDTYKNNSENGGVLRRYDDTGCYGINPASGLPLRSSGTDVAGNPAGSNTSSSTDMFSHNSTIAHNNDTNDL